MTVICSCLRHLSQRRFRFIAMELIAVRESPGRERKGRESGRKELTENIRKGSYGHLQKALNAELKILF